MYAIRSYYAVNLAASLAVMEKRTLLVDLDPQANATSGTGGTPGGDAEKNIYRVLMAEVPAGDAIRETDLSFLHLLPASSDLIGAEIELVGQEGRETKLREALRPLEERYDRITSYNVCYTKLLRPIDDWHANHLVIFAG